jgi:hypothetical protein
MKVTSLYDYKSNLEGVQHYIASCTGYRYMKEI